MSQVASQRRIGRAVLFLHQQDPHITSAATRAELDTLLFTGRSMDFAARLREHGDGLTPSMAITYAQLAGVGRGELMARTLPVLKGANVLDFSIAPDGTLSWIEEYVGLSAPVVDQTYAVLQATTPLEVELAVLNSIEIAAWAPLTRSDHLTQLSRRGFADSEAKTGLDLAVSAGVNRALGSHELGEDIIFNPYVWGTGAVEVARFLRSLPSAERDALVGVCEAASTRPGLALPGFAAFSPSILASARKVGLVQAATVKSTSNPRSSQTYIFSPLLDSEDDLRVTTEALHQRKLFVAHILFGHEKATYSGGRIRDPSVLVNALLRRGEVGPASNIKSDYHLLEAAGIVRVEEVDGGRALLKLVKKEIVESGLAWLEKSVSVSEELPESPRLLRPPGSFESPEDDRAKLRSEAASDEIVHSAVMKLREEAQSVARQDTPF